MKSPVIHGIIIGLATIGWSFLMFRLGWDASPVMRNFAFLSVVILAMGIYSGIYSQRQNTSDGFLDFGTAFRTGLIITVIAAVLGGAYSFIYVKEINPGVGESVILEKTEILRKFGTPEEKIIKHTAWLRKEYSATGQLILNGGGFILLGTFFAAIISVFQYQKSSEE